MKQKLKGKIKRVPSENDRLIPHNLKGFDFATHDQEHIEESEELWAHSHTLEINIVLLCDHPCDIRAKLA